MGLMDFFKKKDTNAGVREFMSERRAMLIDVREPAEYKAGHIPRARNIPLDNIDRATSAIQDRDMPLYVYCETGRRSGTAVSKLEKMGYTNVRNIGGIENYTGKKER